MPAFRANRYYLYFVLVSGAIFSFAYGVHSDASGSMSQPSQLATQDFWPYTSRFLVAWFSYTIFGGVIVDSLAFRIAFSFFCWIVMCLMLPAFAERLRCKLETRHVFAAFVIIMLSHYCVPNVFYPYFIYDMPAIIFYLVVFLLLTDPSRAKIVLGCLLSLLFELNREPIAVALFHAAGWWAIGNHGAPKPSTLSIWKWVSGLFRKTFPSDNTPFVILAVGVTLVAMCVLREVLMYIQTGTIIVADEAHFLEDDHLRITANFARLFTSPEFFQQVLATGFGLIFCLPVVFSRLNWPVVGMVIASIVPLTILLFTNFFSELRIYDEYVPLMSCILATMLNLGNAPVEAEAS